MKKKYFLLTLSLLLLSASNKNKPKPFTQNTTLSYTEFASPVTMTLKGYMVDGFMEGECRGYLKTDLSKLLVVEHYKHSKLDGQYIQYYPGGRIYEVALIRMDSFVSSTLYDSVGYTYLSYFEFKDNIVQMSSNDIHDALDLSVLGYENYTFDTVSRKFIKVQ